MKGKCTRPLLYTFNNNIDSTSLPWVKNFKKGKLKAVSRMPRLDRPFFANFKFYWLMSLAFNLSPQTVQLTHTKNRTCCKNNKKYPSTMNHFRTRCWQEKAAYKHPFTAAWTPLINLSVGSDNKPLISNLNTI